uniref:hypothetical protein n=1 Tax=Acinetobacter gerneri TaxID=202952 RepID=UPI00293BEB38|nr:hypothetical protein [Acinetobacter gerneri]
MLKFSILNQKPINSGLTKINPFLIGMFNVLLLAYQMHQDFAVDIVVAHHHFVELDQVDQLE